jgi:choline monooxygenase
MEPFSIDPDIRTASTLPGRFYVAPDAYAAVVESVFRRSWQLVADAKDLGPPGSVQPFVLLEGCLDEPLLITRNEQGRIRCLSNVCTHRGNLLVEAPGRHRTLICRYHGRRFDLDGCFQSMPEFEGAKGFPRKEDDLPGLEKGEWNRFVFTTMRAPCGFDEMVSPIGERLHGMPFDRLALDAAGTRDYEVHANWALYVENYLEGFHIPFVHAGLNRVVEYDTYTTELLLHGVLQIGYAKGGEGAFDLPLQSPDHGRAVAAYYYWLFPNTMLNFYPWGLSINIVKPLGIFRTRVTYWTYVWDETRRERGAGAGLDKVEMEDEAVVEAVQKGVRSRLYGRGRYSPTRELGVHHFHRLLADALFGP